jgi:predicted NUDIX family phosphoesterase
MRDTVLAVRRRDLASRVRIAHFLALPSQEVHRLYAAVEVVVVERGTVERDPEYQALVTYTAVHHNHSWLTYARVAGPCANPRVPQRSLGVPGDITAEDGTHIFLDDWFAVAALDSARQAVVVGDTSDVRLAGLIADPSNADTCQPLGLVYVARLREPKAVERPGRSESVRFCGPGELRGQRELFDGWSRILIDHLDAL